MILSILIPSIPSRAKLLDNLVDDLIAQQKRLANDHPMIARVCVITDESKSFLDGGLSIGEKRNALIEKSQSDYVCFLDDDESIAPNYVESLVRLCLQDADVVTFRAMTKLKDFWGLVDMRLAYKVNDQMTPEYTVRRPPWHICPVKSKYAKLYKFEDKNNAEDFEWMEKVLRHCTTEAHTDKILFVYNHGDHSEADKIPLPGIEFIKPVGLSFPPLP